MTGGPLVWIAEEPKSDIVKSASQPLSASIKSGKV